MHVSQLNAIKQQSRSPNGTPNRHMDDVYVQPRRTNSGDHSSSSSRNLRPAPDRRITRNAASSRVMSAGRSTSPIPTKENGGKGRRSRDSDTTTRAAQERTVNYYQKSKGSKTQEMDVSMHCYFPESQGQQSTDDRSKRSGSGQQPTHRRRPSMTHIGGGEDAPREKQRSRPQEHPREKQERARSPARTRPQRRRSENGSTRISQSGDSSVPQEYPRQRQERARSPVRVRQQRRRSENGSTMTSQSGDSSTRSARPRDSQGNRVERSRTPEYQPRVRERHQDPKPRRAPSIPADGLAPPPPRRMARRISADHGPRRSPPRNNLREASSRSLVERNKERPRSHGDLNHLEEERSPNSDPKGDMSSRRRQGEGNTPKKTSAQTRRPIEDRPQRRKTNNEFDDRTRRKTSDMDTSDDRSSRSSRSNDNRHDDNRPRRKTNDAVTTIDRHRRTPSYTGDPHDRVRHRGGDNDMQRDRPRRNSGDRDRDRPRRRNSNGSGSTNERSSRQRRVTSRVSDADSVFENGSNSSNPFADAMKTILLDGRDNIGFNTEKEMEKRIADLVWGKFQSSTLAGAGIPRVESVTQLEASNIDPSSGPPRNTATIVLTDVQGSTSLWEANPQAMQEALDIHNKILRRFCAFHNGYEIDTEGDAFFLAFHTPMDAFGFALATQSALYDTEWSKEILATKAGAEEGCYRGLRVRMGVHQGPVTACTNEVTGRTEYVGEAMGIAKCVEGMTHGGQILTTFETWNVASYKAEADLGSPQVVDLGCHVLNPKGNDESVARRIIQLVPASLSFDYFAARRKIQGDDSAGSPPSPTGRQFDPPITDEQVGASFHDAPYKNNEATIAFVYFSEIENQYDDAKPIVAALIRLIGELLIGTPGYHSQSNMLAFPDVNEAVKFGLRLMEELKETKLTDDYADLSKLIKLGCVHDTFLTMGPHKTTGRADYFGKVVNRAARITAKSELGTVNYGVLADDSVGKLPRLDRSIISELKGIKQLKGVQEEMALYECTLDTRPLGLQRGRVVPMM